MIGSASSRNQTGDEIWVADRPGHGDKRGSIRPRVDDADGFRVADDPSSAISRHFCRRRCYLTGITETGAVPRLTWPSPAATGGNKAQENSRPSAWHGSAFHTQLASFPFKVER